MKIITAFPGGNAEVLSIDGDTVYLKPELRDTPYDWFYWCFAVEGAQGCTVTFQFDSKIRVGYYGAAVSYDLRGWHWQLTEDVNPPDPLPIPSVRITNWWRVPIFRRSNGKPMSGGS